MHVWLVVSTPLKNISRLGLLFPIYGKLKKCSKPASSIMLYYFISMHVVVPALLLRIHMLQTSG